jgi:16S rRNA (guanine1207-N2)-methyltransferase
MFGNKHNDDEYRLARHAAEALAVWMQDHDVTHAPVLVVSEPTGQAAAVLGNSFQRVTSWDRRVNDGVIPEAWPHTDLYEAVMLRAPLAREEQEMLLHIAIARLWPGRPLLIWGMKDEGVQPMLELAENLLDAPPVNLSKYHGRVALYVRPKHIAELRGDLSHWRQEFFLNYAGKQFRHVTYPGLFAAGVLDRGTALLLEHLPPRQERLKVLDYGSGSGILSQLAANKNSLWQTTLLDNDALAILAASENLPEARTVIADNLAAVGQSRFDLIISNPPIHHGKQQDHAIVEKLLADAPAHLLDGGQLWLVTQQTVPIARFATAAKMGAAMVAEQDGYRIWRLAAA